MTNEEYIAYIEEWLKDEYALNPKDREVLTAVIKALEELPKRRKEVKRWKTKALEQQKTGYWIYDRTRDWDGECKYECSECGMGSDVDYPYCMRCGCRMVEPQESEE